MQAYNNSFIGYPNNVAYILRSQSQDSIYSAFNHISAINPRAKVIVSGNHSLIVVKSILLVSWNTYRLLDVVVSTKSRIFLLQPFAQQLKSFATSTNLKQIERFKIKEKFNFFGHDLRVSAFNNTPTAVLRIEHGKIKPIYGHDLNVLAILQDLYNFTIKYTPIFDKTTFGARLPNSTFTGGFADIIANRTDYGINNRFTSYFENVSFMYLQPILSTKLCYLVPKRFFQNELKLFLVNFFDTATVVLLILSLCTVVLLYRKLSNLNLLEAILVVFQIAHGVSVPNVKFKRNTRILLASLILIMLIFNNAFQGLIITDLNNFDKGLEIKTLSQLLATNLELSSDESVTTTLRSAAGRLDPRSTLPQLVARARIAKTRNDPKALSAAAYNRTNAYLLPDFVAPEVMLHYFNPGKGESFLELVPDCPVTIPLSYTLHKSSPLQDLLYDLSYRLVESGISEHLFDFGKFLTKLNATSFIPRDVQAIELKLLSFREFETVFYFYCAMMIISVLVFCLEVATFNYLNRFKKF